MITRIRTDVEVDITMYDLKEILDSCNKSEIKDVLTHIRKKKVEDNYFGDSIEDSMKQEWWEEARKKFSLQQLEDKLGNRFNLITM